MSHNRRKCRFLVVLFMKLRLLWLLWLLCQSVSARDKLTDKLTARVQGTRCKVHGTKLSRLPSLSFADRIPVCAVSISMSAVSKSSKTVYPAAVCPGGAASLGQAGLCPEITDRCHLHLPAGGVTGGRGPPDVPGRRGEQEEPPPLLRHPRLLLHSSGHRF